MAQVRLARTHHETERQMRGTKQSPRREKRMTTRTSHNVANNYGTAAARMTVPHRPSLRPATLSTLLSQKPTHRLLYPSLSPCPCLCCDCWWCSHALSP